jgi:hypothetical protein
MIKDMPRTTTMVRTVRRAVIMYITSRVVMGRT